MKRVSVTVVVLLFALSPAFAGAELYWYFVAYDKDINVALQKLRKEEFEAGRYNPVVRHLDFPITASSPKPGAKHKSIAQAIKAAGADGTRSILDIEKVGKRADYSVAAPLSDEKLKKLFGTPRPSRALVESKMDFLEEVERGHCVYILFYKEERPVEILFAGYSFD